MMPNYESMEALYIITEEIIHNTDILYFETTKTKENVTNWFNIETFSKLGEYIEKGKLVAVNGTLRQSAWTDENGNNKSRVYIFADNVQILTPKKEENVEENNGELIQFSDESIPF